MEFGDKLQRLRKEKKLTQEQLAEKLFVSRTAVSKWESGKGYPSIDSLKDIATIFNTTIDELLSGEKIIEIAQIENKLNIKKRNNLIYGLLDIISLFFIFLPLYAKTAEKFVYSVPLISENDINNITKVLYISILLILSLIGVVEIIINFIDNKKVQRVVNVVSLIFQAIAIFFFVITRQIYLTVIMFIILIIKLLILIKKIENKKDLL